jgi:hypothetical protein
MIRYRGRAARYGEVWYEETPPAGHGADIVIHRQQLRPLPGSRAVPFLSLVSDLSVPEAALPGAFDSKCRADIRRADGRDALAWELADAKAVLSEFCDRYDRFAGHKRIERADRQWLQSACDLGRLVITRALQGRECLVWHAYLKCGQTAWLMHSIAQYQDRDAAWRALVGRANRWLHWRDMLALKGMGMTSYDWGGLFEDESGPGHQGVNRFKRSFGGRQMRYYDCTVGVTLRGRMFLPLRDAWRRYGRKKTEARAKARARAWQPS